MLLAKQLLKRTLPIPPDTYMYNEHTSFDPKRNVRCTYGITSLWGFCDTVDDVNYLYVERHIFSDNGFITPMYNERIDWNAFRTDVTMKLDTKHVIFNEGFAMIPYSGYVLFNPMALNPDPLRYNGRGMFAVNGQYIMGYIDHGRHNFATSAGDSGAQILDSKGMLLGLHCAGATVGFTPDSPWRKLLTTANINYFTTLQGEVSNEIKGYDMRPTNVSTNKPVLDPAYVASAFKVVVPEKRCTYDPNLREYFNLDTSSFNKRQFDYKAFIVNIDTYLTTLYNDMSLGLAFQLVETMVNYGKIKF